jgi:hypothetical protein
VNATLVWVAALAAPTSAGAAQPDKPSETLIALSVRPMPAPRPALRYQLLPELSEMTPGNPIPAYLRCMLDQDFSANEETLPPAALRAADRAARLDKPDWQLLPKLKSDGIGLLLPDLQKMRSIAAGLQARFRDEIARGRFDEALVTAKTMFALSRHLGEHPTVIGSLVGIAVAFITLGPVEEMIEQPWCPNLYWALTHLPAPLISLQKGLEGERILIHVELVERAGLSETDPMTPEQLKKFVGYLERLLEEAQPKKDSKSLTRAFIDVRAKDEQYLAGARERLVEYGIAAERVAKFPPEQVILLDEKRKYEERRDEEMKLLVLPLWEMDAQATTPRRLRVPGLFDGLLGFYQKVRWAQARLEQKVALLRQVEALRMYAATHDGKFPEKLDDLGVPLPVDPVTGKPLRYQLEGETAHVRGTPPRGAENQPTFNLHYQITIRK